MIKYLFSLFLFFTSLQAATISTDQDNYNVNQSIVVNVNNMFGATNDWIGIYPVGSDNSWGNVVSWRYTKGVKNGAITLPGVPEGNYEARAFFRNSYTLEATYTFSVGVLVPTTTLSTNKETYTPQEAITLSLSNMSGASNDWVAIYPAGSSNSWDNVLSWKYTSGIVNGNITLTGVPAGHYEARAFFRNSYHLEAKKNFTVSAPQQETAVTTQKENYDAGEAITLSLSNMSGASNDWVAIYPAGSSNSWDNVLSWKYTSGIVNGNITLTGVPAGHYEARAFFRNSYHLEAKKSFTVTAVDVGSSDAKLFIIGDSTVHNTSYGEMGWGSKLGTYMKHPNNAFNRARSGSSSKSYKEASASHHDWSYTKNMMAQSDISEGAYLFIQFGHNDEKSGYVHTEPGRYNSYYNELKKYLDQARDLGFIPVLITPVSRQYVGSRTHGAYPQTMKDLAADEGVLLLDLEYKSYIEFKKYSSDAALQAVFHYDDGTHFNPTGAGIVAGWVKELACNASSTLCNQFQ